MKKIVTLVMAAMLSVAAMAQDKVEGSVGADVVSKYIWRGQNMDAAAVQPSVGISYKGLSLGAWGSYSLTDADKFEELDLTLSYTIGKFNVGITDYWNSVASAGIDRKYFKYGSGTSMTGHTYEANVGYDFGPFSLQWYTNFAGVDGLTEDGKRAYTSYVEANVPFSLGGLDWNATVGAVPYSAGYGNGYYVDANSKGFAVTNVSLKASKDIKITDSFSVPVFAQIATNPSYQKAYLVFGFSIKPL